MRCVCSNGLQCAAFTENLLKSKRWLLHNKPRIVDNQSWENILLMSAGAQELFIHRVLMSFTQRAKKKRVGGRNLGLRWTLDEWDKNADFAAMVTRLVEQAQLTSVDPDVIEEIKTAFVRGSYP